MALADIIIVTAFLLFVLVIGNYLWKWIAGTSDYYVAGRELGPFMGMTPEDYACCCGPTSVPGHPMLRSA